MKYFKVFNTENEYLEYVSSDEFISPNVSTLYDSTKTWLNAEVHDYSRDYLTFDVLTGGTIVWKALGSGAAKTIEYSLNNGSWSAITSTSNGVAITVSQGDSIRFRGENTRYCEENKNNYSAFYEGTATYNAKGNIMSLIYGDNFATATTLTAGWALSNVFNHSNVISAENIIMAATTLTNDCYRAMFANSKKLTKAPKILPARTLANECCYYMFDKCISLTEAPELQATTLASKCYFDMFHACSGLTEAPELPATTLANFCYASMFQDCSSLTKAPKILPATTLAEECYNSMFNGCTALTVAPELPATTLADRCYNQMFVNTDVKYVKCLATDITASWCTENWLFNVPNESGRTFVKSSAMDGWSRDASGIPSAWTVRDESYIDVTGVTISVSEATVEKGSAYTLTATVLPSNADDKVVTWSTSDASIATVDSNGVVSGVGCGNAIIMVTTHDKGYTATCNMSVENHVTSVDLNTYILTLASGNTYQLVATVLPSDACDKSVTWASNNTNVATVDSNGVVSGVTLGSAIVTVTSNDTNSATCNCSVTVNERQHASGVTLSDAAITVKKDNTHTLTATVMPQDAIDKRVTWSTSDASIATVDSNGVVSGVSSGDATITVTTVDGGFTAQCSVSVSASLYTELEYIASTSNGGQYIDLDIKLYETLNTWYDIAIKYNVSGKGKDSLQPTLFGCQNTTSPWPGTFIRMNNENVTNTTGRYIGGTAKDNNLGNNGNDIELPVQTASNMNVTSLNNGGQTHTWGTSLFCAFNSQDKTQVNRFIAAKLYYFKLFLKASKDAQGTLVRDMMPCKRNSDNAIGLLDKVNNVFYSSPNGVAFVAGPEVNA